jgi:isoleucyl-tRNA synthetase
MSLSSKKYKEYKQLNFPEIEKEILEYWDKDNTFEKSISLRPDAPEYVFFEGPPSANGLPGIHHMMARTIKDIFCRYKTIRGYKVERKAGWDTHGLPIELGVEKELGITKEDIGKKISVQAYNDACKKAVMRYTHIWNDLTVKMGYWVDLNNPYITYEPKYMETIWWLLKQMYDKGLLYKGYTIQPYSPKAGTGLSSHELNQPGTYRDVSDTTIVAQFKVRKDFKSVLNTLQGEVFILAWTTTPWTLPSNTALTVGADITYVAIKTFNAYTYKPITVVLAQALVEKVMGKQYFLSDNENDFQGFTEGSKSIPYQVLAEYKGSQLVGTRYEQLLPWALPYQDADLAFQVIDGDFVTTEDGTGIVHTAPTFGADDAKVAKAHGVPPMLVLDKNDNPVPLVDLQGRFIGSLPTGFGGKYVKNEYYDDGKAPERSVDIEIAILLKENNAAFKVEKFVHPYPHCWRTDKPVLYYPLDSWFVKVTACKDRLVALNKTINWKPKATGEGRFGNWLENANDWNLSRSRYWGVPLPIWRTEDGKEETIIGSASELYIEIEKAIQKGFMEANPYAGFIPENMTAANYEKIDLHKHIVDDIFLVSASGKKMYREPDLIDVWFDSGAMPYAQWHYPFENKEAVEKYLTPADFIAEGVDQTRGWFYTLHAISTLVFDKIAYKNVVSNGLVLDKNGNKMSKRLGNAVDPFETIAKYGADTTRWYMISNAQPWDNLKFDTTGIEEVQRKFFGTLYNTYNFFSIYANLDGFTYLKKDTLPIADRQEIDRWIISKLESLTREVCMAYEEYEPTRAARLIEDFVSEHLSNWHVRLSRRRFWDTEETPEKRAAFETLYECLSRVAQLMSPIAPFFADWLYQNLHGSESSVHLCVLSSIETNNVDALLETRMQMAQDICSLILSLRKKTKLKVRQPLQKVLIPVLDVQYKKNVMSVEALILSETNIKEVLYVEDASGIIKKRVRPNFKLLGKKLGAHMKVVGDAISALDSQQIKLLETHKAIKLHVSGLDFEIALDEVEVFSDDIEGWQVAGDANHTVALDITITEALREEGYAREFINKVQNYRKEQNFDVSDKICIFTQIHPKMQQMLAKFRHYICEETLATDIIEMEYLPDSILYDINDVEILLTIQKQ